MISVDKFVDDIVTRKIGMKFSNQVQTKIGVDNFNSKQFPIGEHAKKFHYSTPPSLESLVHTKHSAPYNPTVHHTKAIHTQPFLYTNLHPNPHAPHSNTPMAPHYMGSFYGIPKGKDFVYMESGVYKPVSTAQYIASNIKDSTVLGTPVSSDVSNFLSSPEISAIINGSRGKDSNIPVRTALNEAGGVAVSKSANPVKKRSPVPEVLPAFGDEVRMEKVYPEPVLETVFHPKLSRSEKQALQARVDELESKGNSHSISKTREQQEREEEFRQKEHQLQELVEKKEKLHKLIEERLSKKKLKKEEEAKPQEDAKAVDSVELGDEFNKEEKHTLTEFLKEHSLVGLGWKKVREFINKHLTSIGHKHIHGNIKQTKFLKNFYDLLMQVPEDPPYIPHSKGKSFFNENPNTRTTNQYTPRYLNLVQLGTPISEGKKTV